MKINPIQNTPVTEPAQKTAAANLDPKTNKKDSQPQESVKYTPSNEKGSATYKKPNTVDHATIERLKKQSQDAYANLRNLVEKLLLKQGYTFKDITFDQWQDIEVDEVTRVEAQKMIEPGGIFSAEAVSDRIVEFAKAISGGDVSKLDTLRKAIDKGFKEAEKILRELPEVSKETYKLINEKLDAWAAESNKDE